MLRETLKAKGAARERDREREREREQEREYWTYKGGKRSIMVLWRKL
jgi:hypothetical protein